MIPGSGLTPEDVLYGRLLPAAATTEDEDNAGPASSFKKLGSRQQAVLKLLCPDDFQMQHSGPSRLDVVDIHQELLSQLKSASATETVLYSLQDRDLVSTNGVEWQITDAGINVISALESL